MELRLARDEPAVSRTMWRHAPITVEVRGGGTRYPGTELEAPLPTDWVGYGFFEGLPAEDGDSLDVILGPDFVPDWDGPVFVAEQLDPDDGEKIQPKVLIGFGRKDEAMDAFMALWPSSMFGGLAEFDPDKFQNSILPDLIAAPDEQREPTDVPDAAATEGADDAVALPAADAVMSVEASAAPDVIVWHKLRIVLEALGGEQRPTGDEQQLPVEFRGLGYFEGLKDRSDQDGQELDVVVGGGDLDGPVFLAIQLDDSGAFRQFKSFLGFTDAGQVEAAFKFIWNPKTFGGAWSVPAKRFRKLVLPRLTKSAGWSGVGHRQGDLRKSAVLQLEVDPHRIEAPHGVKNKAKLLRLIEAMKAEGWNGRSILVYRSGGSYQALTGSHRLAAAREAGLARVPVLLIEDSDFDEGSYTALDEAGDNYGRLSALDGLIKAKPDVKPAYELMLQELAAKHDVRMTKSSARPRRCSHCGETMDAADVFGEDDRYFHRPCVGRGPIERTAEKINRKQYRSLVHRCTKAKLLGELDGVEVYRVDGSWVRDHIDVDFAHGAHYAAVEYVPKGEVWVDANLEDKDLAAALVGQLAALEDILRGADEDDAREAAKVAEAEFRDAYKKGKSPFKQVEKWLSRPLEVDGDDLDGDGPPPFKADLPVQLGDASLGDRTAARRRRRKRQRDRVFKPSWYLPTGGRVAVSGAQGAGVGGDENGSVVSLKPEARVLHMSEDALRAAAHMRRAAGTSGEDAFEVFGARDVVAYDLMAMVRSQTEAIQKLTVAVERLQAVNGGHYDAIQTEDRLIVLDPKMVQAEPVRRRWLNASLKPGGGGVGDSDEIEVTG